MYPTIIVILVHYKSAKGQMYGISSLISTNEVVVRDVEATSRPATAGHLSFAVPLSTTGSHGTQALDGQTESAEVQRRRLKFSEAEGMGKEEKRLV